MLWVGTYAAKGGQGLWPLERKGGDLVAGPPVAQIANASFGLYSRRTNTIYFVDEQEAGRVCAWQYQDAGWSEKGATGSGGSLPCYLALDPGHDFLAVANYGDGSVGLVALEPEGGRIQALSDVARHSGRGPDPERQGSPHVHCAVFDETGRSLYAVDLGLDRVFRYDIENGKLGRPRIAFAAPAGSGPRHLLLHPDGRHALLLSELSAELMLLERRNGEFRLADIASAAPEDAGPGNLGGHLGMTADGDILVSNRGHDSVARFELSPGRLQRGPWRKTSSASPRHFVADRTGIVVAHEEGGQVTRMALPGEDGVATTSIAVPGAAFLLEIPDTALQVEKTDVG